MARARRVKLGGAKHNTGLVSIAASQQTVDELARAARLVHQGLHTGTTQIRGETTEHS